MAEVTTQQVKDISEFTVEVAVVTYGKPTTGAGVEWRPVLGNSVADLKAKKGETLVPVVPASPARVAAIEELLREGAPEVLLPFDGGLNRYRAIKPGQ